MSEKLKTTVIYVRTFNLGNYNSVKLGAIKEFCQGEDTIDGMFDELEYEVHKKRETIS